MAGGYVTGTTTRGTAGTASLTFPAGIVAGHVMVMAVTWKLGTGTVFTNPTGWTVVTGPTNGGGTQYQSINLIKKAVGGESGTSITVNSGASSQQIEVALAVYAGVEATPRSGAVAAVNNTSTADTSVEVGAVATQQTGDLRILIGSARGSANGPAGSPNFTAVSGSYAIRQQSTATSGAAQNVGVVIADGSATGAQAITASAAAFSIGASFVLPAAPDSTPGRMYLTNVDSAVVPATKRGAWDNGAATVAKVLGHRPAGTAATAAVAETSATNLYDVLLGRWVSPPAVNAGSLSGTVSFAFGALESNAAANDFTHVYAYVAVGDTDVVRGVLLADYIGSAEWPTTAAGLLASGVAISTVAVQVGDRIVWELGYQAQNTVTTSYSGTINYGNTGTVDLASGDTAVTTAPAWVDFSGLGTLFGEPFGNRADGFDDGTLDPVLWSGSYGGVTEVGGKARIPADTDYRAIESARRFYLRDTAVSWEVPTVIGAAGATADAYMIMSVDASVEGYYLGFFYDAIANQLCLRNAVAYWDAEQLILTRNATTHRWLRLREATGVTYFEASADGLTYTLLRAIPTPYWVGYRDNAFNTETHRDGGSDYAEIDRWNTGPIQVVAPTGVPPADGVGSPTVSLASTPQSVTPAGVASTSAVGAPSITPGAISVSPLSVPSGSAVGQPAVTPAAVTLAPAGVASASAAGSPTVGRGPVSITPAGIAPSGGVGPPVVTPGSVTLSPPGIASAGVVGSPAVAAGAVTVAPSGLPSTSGYGLPSLSAVTTVAPSGVTSSSVVGVPRLAAVVAPVGIASAAAVGQPTVGSGGVVVAPPGVPSAAVVGVPTVAVGGVTIAPAGVPSTSAVGTAVVGAGGTIVAPAGVGSTSALGSPAVTPGAVQIAPAGVAPTAAVGTPVLAAGGVEVAPVGVPATSAVGHPAVAPGPVVVAPDGVPSAAAFGVPTLTTVDHDGRVSRPRLAQPTNRPAATATATRPAGLAVLRPRR